MSLGDKRQAAVALIAGLLVTPDNKELGELLDKVYREIDPKGCSIAKVESELRLDMNCPLVREHVCLAYEPGASVTQHQTGPHGG